MSVNNIKNKKTYYLNIANFRILIIFHQTEKISAKKRLVKQINKQYKFFIEKSTKTKADFIINIKSSKDKLIIKKNSKGAKYLIEFFSHTATDIVNTSYFISIDNFESIITFVLNQLLSNSQGFFLHSSAIKYRSKAILFVGPSGVGKSTLIKLLRNKYIPIANNSIIVKKENTKFYAYQTPFTETTNLVKRSSKSFIINKVFFLEKASFFNIKKISNKENIVSILLNSTNIPKLSTYTKDQNIYRNTLKSIFAFIQKNTFYRFYFKKNKKEVIKMIESL